MRRCRVCCDSKRQQKTAAQHLFHKCSHSAQQSNRMHGGGQPGRHRLSLTRGCRRPSQQTTSSRAGRRSRSPPCLPRRCPQGRAAGQKARAQQGQVNACRGGMRSQGGAVAGQPCCRATVDPKERSPCTAWTPARCCTGRGRTARTRLRPPHSSRSPWGCVAAGWQQAHKVGR